MKKITLKDLRPRQKAMYEALRKQMGVVTAAAEQAGIERTTHYLWLKKDKNYKNWVDQIEDITHDFVENALLKEIKKGNSQAIMFYLRNKARSRGYLEIRKTETDISVKTEKEVIADELAKINKRLKEQGIQEEGENE